MDDVEDHDHVIEVRVDLRIDPVRGGRQLLDELHVRLDALVLVPVDPALVEDRNLDVVAPLREQILRLRGVVEHELADLLPAAEVTPLLGRLHGVDDDAVERAPERRDADLLDAHAVADLLRLDLVERALDRVVRDMWEAADRCAGDDPSGRLPAASGSASRTRRRQLRPCIAHQPERHGEQGEGQKDAPSKPAWKLKTSSSKNRRRALVAPSRCGGMVAVAIRSGSQPRSRARRERARHPLHRRTKHLAIEKHRSGEVKRTRPLTRLRPMR